MPDADRCYLNIPFKTYLTALADAVGEDGTLDPKALRLAASQEFDNYKAIERRINDASCRGGGVTDVFRFGMEPVIATSGGGAVEWEYASQESFYISSGVTLSSSNITVPAGAWIISTQVDVTFAVVPSTSYILISLVNVADAWDGIGTRMYYSDWPTTDDTRNVQMTHHIILDDAATYNVSWLNNTDQDATLGGVIMATGFASAPAVVRGT